MTQQGEISVPNEEDRPETSSPTDPRAAARRAGIVAQRFEHYSPIPMPDVLQGYDRVVPGSAELIIDLYRQQVETRLYCERADVDHRAIALKTEEQAMTKSYQLAQRGQIGFVTLAITAMILGFILAWIGREVVGLGAIVTALGVLAGSLVYGTYQRSKDAPQAKDKPPETE